MVPPPPGLLAHRWCGRRRALTRTSIIIRNARVQFEHFPAFVQFVSEFCATHLTFDRLWSCRHSVFPSVGLEFRAQRFSPALIISQFKRAEGLLRLRFAPWLVLACIIVVPSLFLTDTLAQYPVHTSSTSKLIPTLNSLTANKHQRVPITQNKD